MADFDVVVIGGGPAGYAASLTVAARGASVALVEAEKPGGACVHHACIPTNLLIDPAVRYVEAQELAVMGIVSVGGEFNFARATARKDALVRQMSDGIRTALRLGKVEVIAGRARFESASSVQVLGEAGPTSLSAEAFIIATGTRWEPPVLQGVPPDRVVTADVIQSLAAAPGSAVVLADGPGEVPFGIEYATLLAIAGSQVSLVTARPRLLPKLDPTVASAARAGLAGLGVTVFEGARVAGAEIGTVEVDHSGGTTRVAAELVVAVDVRKPWFEALGLEAAGVACDGRIVVDRRCATNVPGIFAAGDVTGGAMLSSVASHMGDVAAVNATGGTATTRLDGIPRLLHTVPGIAWAGLTEDAARAAGRDPVAGVFDMSYNARALTLGARTGLVKVVADRGLGEILGVHAVGPEAAEVVSVAASLMQAEATIHDLAATIAWHPSVSEGLVEAARRACQE
ncbi:MAG: NAD(P)/FAD-dependent oxidoreductase [Dehalococcoidia bacterium]|nr:NAD(P)/FAD-dependent oxidoreductase [Dehalococcoidia bacterium]